MACTFLFAGQGSQHAGMGADLYETYPAFARVIDEADAAVDLDLKTLMFEDPEGKISDTAYTKEWNFDDPVTSDLVLYAGWEKAASEPAQEPEEPKKPESNTSQNTQNDTLAKTSDSSIILVPMGLAAAGVAAIAASRKR